MVVVPSSSSFRACCFLPLHCCVFAPPFTPSLPSLATFLWWCCLPATSWEWSCIPPLPLWVVLHLPTHQVLSPKRYVANGQNVFLDLHHNSFSFAFQIVYNICLSYFCQFCWRCQVLGAMLALCTLHLLFCLSSYPVCT